MLGSCKRRQHGPSLCGARQPAGAPIGHTVPQREDAWLQTSEANAILISADQRAAALITSQILRDERKQNILFNHLFFVGEKMEEDLEMGFHFVLQTTSCMKAQVHTRRHSHSHVHTPVNADAEEVGPGNPAAPGDQKLRPLEE